MHPISRYALETHSGPYESWPLTSRLSIDGALSEVRVPGYVIEAQYDSPLGALLVTSYDCPFEESSSFVLLDASHRCLVIRHLGVPYSSFLLHEHWVVDAHTIALHYHESLFYTLRIVAPGWLIRRPRLQLRNCIAWRNDARMVSAYEKLQADLRAIAASTASDARG